jgi:beta-N-acetylhexosaminidase
MALFAVLGLMSCTSAHTPSPSPTPSISPIGTPRVTTPPSPSPSPSPNPSCPERVFASMNEDQRVGQLFMVGLRDDRLGPAEVSGIRRYQFGSVSFIRTTFAGVAGVRAVTDAVQDLATPSTTGGVRFYVAANQEGGEIQALRGPGFSRIPPATVQGTLEPAVLQRDAGTWGRELVAAGVNFNFAPVMDVVPPGTDAQNQPIGALHREFGHDVATVSQHGVAFFRGMRHAGVTTSAKHFPGLGRVTGNTDFTAGVVDHVTTPDDPYLQTFQDAIDTGVPFVMVALATYTKIDPKHLAVFSPTVMTLLREGMGFGGVIISDDIGAAVAVSAIPPGVRAVEFLSAGGDMIVTKFVEPAGPMAAAVRAKMRTDPAFRGRVHDAVVRILAAKDASGLLPCSG